MPPSVDSSLLTRITAKRPDILAAAARHGARNVRLFGSVARGTADATSDIDILVDLETGSSLLISAPSTRIWRKSWPSRSMS